MKINIEIKRDGNGSPYIEWKQAEGGYKRAWIQKNKTQDKDWAKTPRYLNVVRCNKPGQTGGNPTDFPIFLKEEDISDEQILISFVYTVSSITGCKIEID